jgi:hypothetical protein
MDSAGPRPPAGPAGRAFCPAGQAVRACFALPAGYGLRRAISPHEDRRQPCLAKRHTRWCPRQAAPRPVEPHAGPMPGWSCGAPAAERPVAHARPPDIARAAPRQLCRAGSSAAELTGPRSSSAAACLAWARSSRARRARSCWPASTCWRTWVTSARQRPSMALAATQGAMPEGSACVSLATRVARASVYRAQICCSRARERGALGDQLIERAQPRVRSRIRSPVPQLVQWTESNG